MAHTDLRSLSAFAGLCVAPAAMAFWLVPIAAADSASWNGEYAITFIVGPKAGTSMAAGQPEQQHTETYGFQSNCANGKCTATIISGPPPSNPTVLSPFSSPGMGHRGRRPATFSGSA